MALWHQTHSSQWSNLPFSSALKIRSPSNLVTKVRGDRVRRPCLFRLRVDDVVAGIAARPSSLPASSCRLAERNGERLRRKAEALLEQVARTAEFVGAGAGRVSRPSDRRNPGASPNGCPSRRRPSAAPRCRARSITSRPCPLMAVVRPVGDREERPGQVRILSGSARLRQHALHAVIEGDGEILRPCRRSRAISEAGTKR